MWQKSVNTSDREKSRSAARDVDFDCFFIELMLNSPKFGGFLCVKNSDNGFRFSHPVWGFGFPGSAAGRLSDFDKTLIWWRVLHTSRLGSAYWMLRRLCKENRQSFRRRYRTMSDRIRRRVNFWPGVGRRSRETGRKRELCAAAKRGPLAPRHRGQHILSPDQRPLRICNEQHIAEWKPAGPARGGRDARRLSAAGLTAPTIAAEG
jgi:hypothetical protein